MSLHAEQNSKRFAKNGKLAKRKKRLSVKLQRIANVRLLPKLKHKPVKSRVVLRLTLHRVANPLATPVESDLNCLLSDINLRRIKSLVNTPLVVRAAWCIPRETARCMAATLLTRPMLRTTRCTSNVSSCSPPQLDLS